ncbi:MAG: hypothetical protein HXY34_01715 [Candidatus Thorarchaeota archaeon]|nr:hypothetical protein [Candidatus Thorarchaeota archaeon]
MDRVVAGLDFNGTWRDLLRSVANSEVLVDIFLCSNAYGNPEDRSAMVKETHGVRVISVGEDYIAVGPGRPVYSSMIPLGWISMIRVHEGSEDYLPGLMEASEEGSPTETAVNS